MRIKGYAIIPAEEAAPVQAGPGQIGVGMSKETDAQLGHPSPPDVVLCLTTNNPAFMELICITNIRESCQDIDHLVENHLDEIAAALKKFKKNEPKG